MFHSSRIEISKSALQSNISYIKNLIGENVILSSVVKGNAYGHGIEQFVQTAKICGINHFSVYSADEAYRVYKALDGKSEIMIMGWIDKSVIEWAIRKDVQFYVFNFFRLEETINLSKILKKKARIHIELETGMNRSGFIKKDFNKLFEILNTNAEHLIIEGLCTHYAGAESVANYVRINSQYKKFLQYNKWFSQKGLNYKAIHSASSAATMSYPKMRMDMVRVGILLYGFWPSQETFIEHISKQKLHHDPLKRIISWKSKIMGLKTVKRGEFIGYGNYYIALREMLIALVPVGYSHGFSRSMTNTGRVLIHGKRSNVVGAVNMNMIIVDVTDIAFVKIGDEVVLIGTQLDGEITVHSFTEMSEQMNYELLTRLPTNIPRKIVA
ncbi:MAG: alanine racemase [Melioribacteraceae bacterium]|nr:alanine racemase [Melioribacteraceae bacterium]MCF8413910.1 alanine racemase [Melioribacteraceae bacterium]